MSLRFSPKKKPVLYLEMDDSCKNPYPAYSLISFVVLNPEMNTITAIRSTGDRHTQICIISGNISPWTYNIPVSSGLTTYQVVHSSHTFFKNIYKFLNSCLWGGKPICLFPLFFSLASSDLCSIKRSFTDLIHPT